MFKPFKLLVQQRFNELLATHSILYLTDVDKDEMWEAYLSAFSTPEERQSHTCNCCRQFIKNYGNIVAIHNGELITMWDVIADKPDYTQAAINLNSLVKSSVVRDIFLNDTSRAGTDFNTQQTETGIITWNHFFVNLPVQFVNKTSLSIEARQGTARDVKNVFKRSLDEISIDAIDTVLELIAQDSLYRGDEFKATIQLFRNNKVAYDKATNKDNFVWSNSSQAPQSVSKIRNSAIGTLLTDISEGKELDYAVGAFERMVAPTNYKRPTALVTKGMIEEAEKTIMTLGLTESLGRRHATEEDVPVTNLLFVNRDAKKALGIFDEMKEAVEVNLKSLAKVEEISIDTFISDVLPHATSLEVLLESRQAGNFVSLITAKDDTAPTLFKWDNPFSWSYANAVADSIKEQVKAAGGKVEGELRVSLSWFNHDDLDLHVYTPRGNRIYYGNRTDAGGHLDVDMNAGGRISDKPVENTIFSSGSQMQEGKYIVVVNQYNKRQHHNTGFIVEVECRGELFTFEHKEDLRSGNVTVVEFEYSRKDGIKMTGGIKSQSITKNIWSLDTNKFHKVSMVMHSPNYWNGQTGNKHTFFMLKDAKNDELPRGFFNEFLKEDLLKNKRVFEVLGGKLKVEDSDKQLSGLGFSSTQRNNVIVRVESKFKRVLKINF